MPNQSQPVKILSMDGGGLGGLVTARLLQSIAQTIPDFLKDITLIAGTSAGAVNALILAQYEDPVDGLEACIRLWQEPKLLSNTLWGTLLALGGLGPFISADNYRSILQRYIDQRLILDELKKKVLITAFNLADPRPQGGVDWRSRIITNWSPDHRRRSALDVALRAGAAPILQAIQQGSIDGGVFNPDPSMSALTQLGYAGYVGETEVAAEKAVPEPERWARLIEKGQVHLLSVGCGYARESIRVSQTGPTPWGYLQWMVPSPLNNFTYLADLLLDAQEEIMNTNLEQVALMGLFKYQRLEPLLKLGLFTYNFTALNPFLRPWVITQLERVCQTPATVQLIQGTIDWLYETGWSKRPSDTSTAATPDGDKR